MSNQAPTKPTIIKTYIPQCQVLWFQWAESDEVISNESLSSIDTDRLSNSNVFDISDNLQGCTFGKHLSEPSGTFSLRLDSTKDWKDAIKPGHWMLILMTQDGDLLTSSQIQENTAPGTADSNTENPQTFKSGPQADDLDTTKIRGICRVDRVATNVTTGPNGEYLASYTITGRDYGCIYQDTEIWYNLFLNESVTIPTLNAYIKAISQNNVNGSLTYLLKVVHDLVLSLNGNKDLQNVISAFKDTLSLPTQWIMPKKLLEYIGQLPETGSPYYGDIADVLNLNFTPFSMPVINPLTYIQGNLWEKLKGYSAQQVHELFTETTDDGQMRLNFRLIPWVINSEGFPNIAKAATTFQALCNDPATSVTLASVELLSLDLGEDDHNRKNHFLTMATPYFTQATNAISQLTKPSPITNRKFPLANAPSVARNGYRPAHIELETFFIGFNTSQVFDNTSIENSPVSTTYLLEANELVFDYFNKLGFYETGSLTIMGKNEIKIGKGLALDDTFPYNPGSFYYIEGYEDEFSVDERGACSWIQHLFVTHGIEAKDLENGGVNKTVSKKTRTYNKESSFIKKNGA